MGVAEPFGGGGNGEAVAGFVTLPLAQLEGLRADGSVAIREGDLPPALTVAAAGWYAGLLQEVVTGLDRIAEAREISRSSGWLAACSRSLSADWVSCSMRPASGRSYMRAATCCAVQWLTVRRIVRRIRPSTPMRREAIA